jgi:transcriptional regulator with XRE-family HTH domain
MNANVIARKLGTLQQKGAMKASDVAEALGIRPETVSRWNQGKAFPQPDAERALLDLEYVVDRLGDLYRPDEARMWLLSRQRLLGDARPVDLIKEGRTDEVLQMLRQLLEGVHV